MRCAGLVFSLLLAAAGCTQPEPLPTPPPGSPEADFLAASNACEAEAMTKAPPVSLGLPGVFPSQTTWCAPTAGGPNCVLINPGYLPQSRAAVDSNAGVRERWFESCMLARHWKPGPAPASLALSQDAVSKALAFCNNIFRGKRTEEFDRCVLARAQEFTPPMVN